jgi:FAD/FMN-containing dehydrogenase
MAAIAKVKAIQGLREGIRGTVLLPDETDYDTARRVFNGMIDKRPAVIVRCLGASDVSRSIEFARENDLGVAIRGGGHNTAGHGTCAGGVLIDLGRMRTIRVDPVRMIAFADPGCNYTDFDIECQAFGLATTGGTVASTGIAGLTLGGGLGHLMGRYGLACDNVLAADMVLADGRFVSVNAGENQDLYWAVRGGGGNFGVITSFQYQLHPVAELYGGLIMWPAERTGDVLRVFREVTMSAPDELTATFAVITLPDDPGRVVLIAACYAGSAADGERAVRPFRSLGGPILDGAQRTSYLEVQRLFAEVPFGLRNYWKGHFVREMTDEAIAATVECAETITSEHSAILIEAPHGAASRVGDEQTAYSQRDKRYNMSALAIWEGAEEDDRHVRWARRYAQAIESLAKGAAYVNYLEEDAKREQVRAAYGAEKFSRLSALKAKYDPTNLFRFNQNIPPAA